MAEMIIASLKWVIGGLLSLLGVFFFHQVNQTNGRIDKVESAQEELRTAHELYVQEQLKRCADIHARERTRFDDMATKGDIRDLRNEMQNGFENINNNIITLAQK